MEVAAKKVGPTFSEWSEIRRICEAAAEAPVNPELWIGPYQRALPEWTYVERTGEGLAGYLTGCPDTDAFRATQPPESVLFAADAFFPTELLAQCRTRFPAHLHINVDARYRGHGVGRRLIERFVRDLAANGIPGAHLFCGPGPVEFYRRCGFRVTDRRRSARNIEVALMVLDGLRGGGARN